MDQVQEIRERHKKIQVAGYVWDYFIYTGPIDSPEKEWSRGVRNTLVTDEADNYESERDRIRAEIESREITRWNREDNMAFFERYECKDCEREWPCDVATLLEILDQGVN